MARMEAELVIDAGRAVVTLGGALDSSNAHRLGALLRRLISEGCTEILADMSAVSRVDAAAIGILRGAATALGRDGTGGRLVCAGARASVAVALAENGIDTAEASPAGEPHEVDGPVVVTTTPKPREAPVRRRTQTRTTTRARVSPG